MQYSKPVRLVRNGRQVKNWYTRTFDGVRTSCRTLGTPSYEEALRRVEALRKGQEGYTRSVTLGRAIEAWLVFKEARVDASTLSSYRKVLSQWIEYLGERTPIREITAEDVERRIADMRSRKLAARTANNALHWFRSCLAWCCRRGWLDQNPLVVLHALPERHREIRALEPEEQNRLLRSAADVDARLYGTVLCLLRSGLRRGTVERLTWDDVDLPAGRWRIPAEKMKSRVAYLLPIEPLLLCWLRRRQQDTPPFRTLTPVVWRALCSAAGITDVRPHDLRRTFVTTLRRGGVPLDVAMKLSDHRDIQTVMECYRAVDADECATALAAAFARPSSVEPDPEPAGEEPFLLRPTYARSLAHGARDTGVVSRF